MPIFDDFLPEERDEQGQQLASALRHIHDTAGQDAESLARIRARFLARTATALPASNEPDDAIATTSPTTNILPYRPYRNDKPWYTHLNTLVALILVTVLIGSLVLLFVNTHTETGKGPGLSLLPPLRSGWTAVASYSGTHNETIQQDIQLTPLWGLSLVCHGNGRVQVNVNTHSTSNFIIVGCSTQEQQAPTLHYPGPTTIQLATKNQTIHGFTVTVTGSLIWAVQFDNATNGPHADGPGANRSMLGLLTSPSSGWSFMSSGGATGDTTMYNFPTQENSVRPVETGLLVVCSGVHGLQMAINPNAPDQQTVNIAQCNEQPQFRVFPSLRSLQVNAQNSAEDANPSVWQLQVFSCSNEKVCQQVMEIQ